MGGNKSSDAGVMADPGALWLWIQCWYDGVGTYRVFA